MNKSIALFALILATIVNASPSLADYISSESHSYTLQCNANGYILTSINPVTRFMEAGAKSHVETLDPEKLYLGRSCDTFSKVLGKGKWCWANGGFRAEFGTKVIGFPRQAIECANPSYQTTPCGC